MMRDPSKNQVNITNQWSKCMNIPDKFEEAFNTFKTSGSAESNLFAYWNNFLSKWFLFREIWPDLFEMLIGTCIYQSLAVL